MTVSIATHQRVYEHYREHAQAHGYAPTSSEAARALSISQRSVITALQWLAARRFVAITPRRWRGVRITARVCACGVEIEPMNAVDHRMRGKPYVRGICRSCYNAYKTPYKQTWNVNNPGYNARWLRRYRQQEANAA